MRNKQRIKHKFIVFCIMALFHLQICSIYGAGDDRLDTLKNTIKQPKIFLLYAFESKDPFEDYVVKLSHDLTRQGIDAFTAVERGGAENIHSFFNKRANEAWLSQEENFIALCFSRMLMQKYLEETLPDEPEPIVRQEVDCLIELLRNKECVRKILFFFLDGKASESIIPKFRGKVYIDFREGVEKTARNSPVYEERLTQIIARVSGIEREDSQKTTRVRKAFEAFEEEKPAKAVAAASAFDRGEKDLVQFFGPQGILQPELEECIFSLKEEVTRQTDKGVSNLTCTLCYPASASLDLVLKLRRNIRIGGIEVHLSKIEESKDLKEFNKNVGSSSFVVLLSSLQLVTEFKLREHAAEEVKQTDPLYQKLSAIKQRCKIQQAWDFLHVLCLDNGLNDYLGDMLESTSISSKPFFTARHQFVETFELVRTMYAHPSMIEDSYVEDLVRSCGEDVQRLVRTEVADLHEEFEARLERAGKKEHYEKAFNYLKSNAVKKKGQYHDSDDIFSKFKRKFGEEEIFSSDARSAVSEKLWEAGRAFKNIALCFEKEGFYELANNAYQKSRQLLELCGNGPAAISARAFCECSLGRLYYKQLAQENISEHDDGHTVKNSYRRAFTYFADALALNSADAYAAYYLARLLLGKHVDESLRVKKNIKSPIELLKDAVTSTRAARTDETQETEQFILKEGIREHAKKIQEALEYKGIGASLPLSL